MLNKANRLITRYQYNKVRRFGGKYSTAYFNLFYLDISKFAKNLNTQFGFITSTKLHKSATKRNRVKRIFREVIRLNFGKIKPGFWIVIYPKHESLDKTYAEINADFLKALQNLPFTQ